MSNINIAILGGGITGLTLGTKLQEKGINFTIFEKEKEVGGLCKTTVNNGYFYDLHGGHIFNSRHREVIDWTFKKLAKKKWVYSVKKALIQYGNQILNYPFEFSLVKLPIDDAIECILDFFTERGIEPSNYYDWIVWMFGKSISEKYMIPYNEKIWQYDLREMSIDWIDGKMPLPTKEEILRAFIAKDPFESRMPHYSYYYPVDKGIGGLIEAISPNDNILVSFNITELRRFSGKWMVNDIGPFDRIIWTIPLPYVSMYLNAPVEVQSAILNLKWNSLTTFHYSSADPVKGSWTYFPEKKYPFHRIVNQGGLSPKACPESKGSFIVEMIGKRNSDELLSFFDKESLVGESHTDFAYVLFDKNHAINSEMVKNYLRHIGIIPLGRFAEWQYYNMDICMKRAFECAEKLSRLI